MSGGPPTVTAPAWLEVPATLREGGSVVVNPGNIAVFLKGGAYFAVANKCAHGKGMMSLGDIEELSPCLYGSNGASCGPVDLAVICPKHRNKFPGGLKFDLRTGLSFVSQPSDYYSPSFRLATYPTKTDGQGRVWVSTQPTPGSEGPRTSVLGNFIARVKRRMSRSGEAPAPASSSTAPPPPAAAPVAAAPAASSSSRSSSPSAGAASASESFFEEWTVTEVTQCSHDTFLYVLAAPAGWQASASAAQTVTTELMWHVALRARVGASQEMISRDYTPVSTSEEYLRGRLDLWIKIYPTGVMTQHLAATCAPGVRLSVGQPEQTSAIPAHASHLGLLSGGTGVTPMIQAAYHVVRSPAVSGALLWSVRDARDAVDLITRLLKTLAAQSGGRLRVGVTFTREKGPHEDEAPPSTAAPVPADTVLQLYGRLAVGHVRQLLGPPASSTAVFVSGPEAFNATALTLLSGLGFESGNVFELEA
jgi:ferredoxin-NADP reductase/nitrite reductase/ring-hydroxylating ferredoxin subunit